MRLSDKQREILSLLATGGSIRCHCTPGTDKWSWFLQKKDDHRDLDGRTCTSLDARGFIKFDGGDYILTDAGRAALTPDKRTV